MSDRVILEVCLDSPESALAARDGGARRIELCAAMADGGITPSHGMIAAVRRAVRTPLHVLVRPRPGDFVYSARELRLMADDVLAARDLGADGVVVGALTPRGAVDAASTAALVRAAGPLDVTFHRAFDQVARMEEALEEIVGVGVGRILTSGGRPTAAQGRERIGRLVEMSAGRIAVMAGGGVNGGNVRGILRASGVREVHVGSAVAAVRASGRGGYRARIGIVDASRVRALVDLLGAVS